MWLRDGVAMGRAHADRGARRRAGLVHAWRAAGDAPRRLRRDPDAQGPALRHGVHLLDLHPRARGAAGRAGREPAAGPARHEREGLHGLVPRVLRAHADHAATWPTCMHSSREHQRAVCKPLYGMGGRSIFVLDADDKNASVVFETLTEYGTRYAIVQRYIPDIVATGDARVILVDGEPVPYALARIPSAVGQPGQPGRGRQGRRPAARRARPVARRAGSGRSCASAGCCSSASTSSAASSPRST